jgi:hypothetical protein
MGFVRFALSWQYSRCMVGLLHIFLIGIGVLVGALILNAVATKLGLATWYDFLKQPDGTSGMSYVWLFLIYPMGLGATVYGMMRILKIFMQ